MSTMKEKETENNKGLNPACPCPKVRCRRHGDCVACKGSHCHNAAFCQTGAAGAEEAPPAELRRHAHHRHAHHRRGLGKFIAVAVVVIIVFAVKLWGL